MSAALHLEELTMTRRCMPWRINLGIGCLAACMTLGLATETVSLEGFRVSLNIASAQDSRPTSELEALPDSKTMTVVVEGEPQTVRMQLYERPGVPLVTYYPPAMTTSEACDDDGCFVSFTYEDLGAAVFFLIPQEAEVASQAEPYITGEDGLLTVSGWTVTGEHTSDTALRYPWAKKVITFQSEDLSAIGAAVLGELEGQAFAAVEVFPPDAGDGFAPQAHAILSEMQMR